VLLCLVPAFFIAGAIGVFVSQASVIRYLGARANKVLATGVVFLVIGIYYTSGCTPFLRPLSRCPELSRLNQGGL